MSTHTFSRPAARSGRPGRGGSSRRAPERTSAPAPKPAGDLELALTAALDAPAPAASSFEELGLPAPLVAALAAGGVITPFPIQARTAADALAGRDVLGRAQTGSGKTLAFGLPVLTRLAASGQRRPGAPRALVLVPTRELAVQVTDALDPLARALRLRVTAVYGGASIGRQIDALRRGVDLVVATPGRLIDLMDRGACGLEDVDVTVLDEADYMADLGFLPAVTRILDATPAGAQRLLFSATLDRGVDRLVRRYLTDPACHAVAPAAAPVEAMRHQVFRVAAADKVAVTAEIAARPGRTLLFVRTKHGADRLAKQLTRSGADAAAIHGNLNQNARQRALDAFAAGQRRVLVATDVAARGIHVDDVDLVVHYDPPTDSKDYLHRSGRTARAGAEGTVVSLVQADQVRTIAKLHEDARVSASTVSVQPGHPAVRELATSGEAIVPATVANRTGEAAAPEGHRAASPRRSRRPGTYRGRRTSDAARSA